VKRRVKRWSRELKARQCDEIVTGHMLTVGGYGIQYRQIEISEYFDAIFCKHKKITSLQYVFTSLRPTQIMYPGDCDAMRQTICLADLYSQCSFVFLVFKV
jgi:hypothetical protein